MELSSSTIRSTMGAEKLRQVLLSPPGETSKVYTFTWSGALPADHTYPAPGGVQVTSPNQLTSALMAPTGQCTAPVAPTCGSNFSSPISQSYQSTLTTAYGTVPLPPMSRTVPNDAAGGVRGYDICSAGTASTITALYGAEPARLWLDAGEQQRWHGNLEEQQRHHQLECARSAGVEH